MRHDNAWLKKAKCLLAASTVAASGGYVLASGCTAQQISAVLNGVEAVASGLNDRNNDDDIDFGDWLADEFDDL